MENPFLEAGSFSTGHRVAFRHEGKVFEPIAGQFIFDFAAGQKVITRNATFGNAGNSGNAVPADADVSELFAHGESRWKDDRYNQLQAIAMYQQVLEIDDAHAAAHINLGTLYYNRQEFTLAEQHYRDAIESDPRYALAYFDLANVLDETGRVAEAIQTYAAALQLAPDLCGRALQSRPGL